MTQPRSPTDIDAHIGKKLLWRRKEKRMSQTQLGNALGITFQQIQKYEHGSNRISASRLWAVADILNVPISYFYEGVEDRARGVSSDGSTPTDDPVSAFMSSSYGVKMAMALAKIESMETKAALFKLAEATASDE